MRDNEHVKDNTFKSRIDDLEDQRKRCSRCCCVVLLFYLLRVRRLTCTIHTSTGMETCRISHWTVLYLKDQSVSNSQSPHRTQRCSMDSQWPENLRISLSSTNGSRPDGVVSPSKPVELLLSLLNANSSVMAWSSCGLQDPAKTAITIS